MMSRLVFPRFSGVDISLTNRMLKANPTGSLADPCFDRVVIDGNNQPDRVTLNGKTLGTSTIAAELTEGLRTGTLPPEPDLRQRLKTLVTTLNLSQADPWLAVSSRLAINQLLEKSLPRIHRVLDEGSYAQESGPDTDTVSRVMLWYRA